MSLSVPISITLTAFAIALNVGIVDCLGNGFCNTRPAVASTEKDERVYIVVRGPKIVHLETPIEIRADGVIDGSGREFGWEQIIQGNVGEEFQPSFEQSLSRWGLILFRLEQCLVRGDWSGLQALDHEYPLASLEIGPRYQSWICMAQYELALFAGHREEALLAFLKWSQLGETSHRERLRFPKVILPDRNQGPVLDPRLIPLWFNVDAARSTLTALKDSGLNPLEPRTEVYSASLEIAAQDWPAIANRLERWAETDSIELQTWRPVFLAANEVAQGQFRGAAISLENPPEDVPPVVKVVGNYWLRRAQSGRAKTPQQHRRAILGWLRFSLQYQETHAALAAAGLAEARELALLQNWQTEAMILENELYQKYASSYHAKAIKVNESVWGKSAQKMK